MIAWLRKRTTPFQEAVGVAFVVAGAAWFRYRVVALGDDGPAWWSWGLPYVTSAFVIVGGALSLDVLIRTFARGAYDLRPFYAVALCLFLARVLWVQIDSSPSDFLASLVTFLTGALVAAAFSGPGKPPRSPKSPPP